MPESVKDRLSKKYEYIFHFVKSRKYYYNLDMIREPYETWEELFTRETKPFGKKGSPNYRLAPVEESYGVLGDVLSVLKRWGVDKNLEYHGEAIKNYDKARAQNPSEVKKRIINGLLKELGLNKLETEVRKKFIEGLRMTYEEMKKTTKSDSKYDSKYSKHKYGQNPQGFIRDQSLARLRQASRKVAKKLFPGNPTLQQKFVNWVHDHASSLRGKNPGDIWIINTRPFKGAHFAVYPIDLVLRPILASCPPNGVVLDPMCGSGTTLVACELINRKMWDEFRIFVNEFARKTDWNLKWIGIEINPDYAKLARQRLKPFLPRKKILVKTY